VPTIVSDRTSLPEVVGEAGAYIDPENIESISNTMVELLEDRDRRMHLAALGRERAGRFTWQACAEKTYQVYEKVLREKH
jgi:alpha-1,3-rhamnosyl/mannosyltransferase